MAYIVAHWSVCEQDQLFREFAPIRGAGKSSSLAEEGKTAAGRLQWMADFHLFTHVLAAAKTAGVWMVIALSPSWGHARHERKWMH